MSGIKPKEKVNRNWSPELAYAIGLIVTDGCLSKDGRHIDLTSKDKSQLKNFMRCLKINVKIGYKLSGYTGKKVTHIQFGDIVFYKFLIKIGLMPAKTKIISSIKVPDDYFFDFLRGHFDGDGSFYSYFDPRWKSSFMFYTVFVSSSKVHIDWIRKKNFKKLKIKGHITNNFKKSIYQLKYAKSDSLKVLRKMYYNNSVVCLKRKRLKIEKALGIIDTEL